MLQQTGVNTVIPYYRSFLVRWPKVEDLANANLDEVLHAWQGLGYYARARNLHKSAKIIATKFDCIFPDTEDGLLQLPGIGPYTAAAIAAIAFGRKTTPVDGNIERVMARLFAIDEPLPAAKSHLYELARGFTPDQRAGDHAQALMDLGATVCLSRAPHCDQCPLKSNCLGLKEGVAENLPRRETKKQLPTRYGVAFCLLDNKGCILLRRRPEKGLLGGMMEVPSTPWRDKQWHLSQIISHAPIKTQWREISKNVVHTFTHFRLELAVMSGSGWRAPQADEIWHPTDALDKLALPTVMKKILQNVF